MLRKRHQWSEFGTYKTVKARLWAYTTVKATYKTVNAIYKTVKATYKTVKATHKTVKARFWSGCHVNEEEQHALDGREGDARRLILY